MAAAFFVFIGITPKLKGAIAPLCFPIDNITYVLTRKSKCRGGMVFINGVIV
jgi:hypothetical protein